MLKGRYSEAFDSLARLRRHKIQAARDLYCELITRYIVVALYPIYPADLRLRQISTFNLRRRRRPTKDATASSSCSLSLAIVVLP